MAKAAPKKSAKSGSAKSGSVKPGKAVAPVKKPAAVKAPVMSKDELRVQLEKALKTIATLRAKSREAVRAAKVSAAQIAELETKLAQLEKKLASQVKPAKSAKASDKTMKPRGRKTAVIADGDAPVEAADVAPEAGAPAGDDA